MTDLDGLVDELFRAAVDAEGGLRTRDEIERMLANRDAPPPSKVHDWRNHVPDVIANNWDQLSKESRLTAFIFAAALSRGEEWR